MQTNAEIRVKDVAFAAAAKRHHRWLDLSDASKAELERRSRIRLDRDHEQWLASGEPDWYEEFKLKRSRARDVAKAEWRALHRWIYEDSDADATDAQIAEHETRVAEWHRKFDRLFPSHAGPGIQMSATVVPFPLPTPIEPAPQRIRPRRVDASSLHNKEVQARQWLVTSLIPRQNVTLLYGDGGTGKSLLALQLAVAVVTGTHFFKHPASQGTVEFVTAEDSLDELHRRLADIAKAAGRSLADLGGLNVTSLADDDALLAVPEDGRGGALVGTALYAELDTLLSETRPALVVLDTLADVYGGNEIIRAQVRQFIGMLRRLALRYDTTVVVLAHPSMAGMDKGTSGSTGWSNSVRSRLYFQRCNDSDGSEVDEDARVLRVAKSNYGRVGLEIPMRWQNGVFSPAETHGGDPLSAGMKADKVFLDLLAKFTLHDRPVSVATGPNYAPKQFESEARAQGVRKRELVDAMNRLLDAGRIQNVMYGPPSRGAKRLVIKSWTAP